MSRITKHVSARILPPSLTMTPVSILAQAAAEYGAITARRASDTPVHSFQEVIDGVRRIGGAATDASTPVNVNASVPSICISLRLRSACTSSGTICSSHAIESSLAVRVIVRNRAPPTQAGTAAPESNLQIAYKPG